MMKKLSLYLLYILFFLVCFIMFIPKTNIYYSFEQEMAKKNVIFSNETIEENLFSLDLKNIELFYKKQYVLNIEQLNISYNLVTPIKLHAQAQGKFGTLTADINFMKRTTLMRMKASAFMKKNHIQILRNMKLDKGEYVYELKF